MDAVTVAEANAIESQNGEEVGLENGTPQNPENRFQKAIAAWRSVGLASLISQLDGTATEIINHQKDAVLERKDVAQKTKDFRKLDDAGKLAEHKALLKTYQGFIDLLTIHGKESTSAFLQLYTALSEAPDPFPLLEASVEALVVSEDTVPRLTSENAELQKRVQKLTQEIEVAENRLQTERQARKEAEAGSGKKSDEIEATWKKVLEEKEADWQIKEKALEEKVEHQERLFKELRANYEVAQRLGKDEQENAARKAASAELQLITSDLEKTSARLSEVEARNEQLRIELAQATSRSTNTAEDGQILRLQSENSSLLRRLESIRFDRDGERKTATEQLRSAERQRDSAREDSKDLRVKLQRYSDYDEIKRELDMLKSIELPAEDDNEADDGEKADDHQSSIEQLLLSKNKKLSSDLTLLRVSQKELLEQLDQLKEDLTKSTTDLEDSRKLNVRLENDISQLQEEAANGLPSSGMSVAGTYVSRYPHSSRRGRSSPTSSIISGFDGNNRSFAASERSGEMGSAPSSILPMVQAQRDRFKQKTQQLEEELQKAYATVSSLRQEVNSLQKDNLNLYEKSRYVSAYSRGGATSSSLEAPLPTTVGEDGDRWKAQYEANISPFAAFRGREASKAYRRMSMPERMVFSLTRIVLATRTSRNLFAGYCLALHVLVFFMLYWVSAASGVSSHAYVAPGSAAAMGVKNPAKGLSNNQEFG